MSAPLIWIIIPGVFGIFALLITNQRILFFLGGVLALLLAFIAIIIPIDTALQFGNLSLKIAPAIEILGRRLVLIPADGPLLAIFFVLVAIWLFGCVLPKTSYRLVPLGLIISSLMIVSIAVEPFLYAAILIEIAVLLAIPLLLPLNKTPGPGLMRFLIYQTLGMPFILIDGWMLSGVESSPGDLDLAVQSATI